MEHFFYVLGVLAVFYVVTSFLFLGSAFFVEYIDTQYSGPFILVYIPHAIALMIVYLSLFFAGPLRYVFAGPEIFVNWTKRKKISKAKSKQRMDICDIEITIEKIDKLHNEGKYEECRDLFYQKLKCYSSHDYYYYFDITSNTKELLCDIYRKFLLNN